MLLYPAVRLAMHVRLYFPACSPVPPLPTITTSHYITFFDVTVRDVTLRVVTDYDVTLRNVKISSIALRFVTPRLNTLQNSPVQYNTIQHPYCVLRYCAVVSVVHVVSHKHSAFPFS